MIEIDKVYFDEMPTEDEILKLINDINTLPKEENDNCLSAYGSIDVNDLINVIKDFKKVPTYDELLKEHKQLKEIKNILNNPNNHFEDGCDCLKIEELLEKSDR